MQRHEVRTPDLDTEHERAHWSETEGATDAEDGPALTAPGVSNNDLASTKQGRLSAAAYFAFVAAATALGIGVAMSLRPSFAHTVKETLGLERTVQASPSSFYAMRVQPIFEEHCIACHGERRAKSRLRLDSFAHTMRGGKTGSVVQANHPGRSELVRRMLLPSSKDEAMPPEGRPPIAADEVKIVKMWVAAGASPTLPATAIKGAPAPVRRVEFPGINEAAVAQQRATIAPIVQQLQAQWPGVIDYESRASAYLEVNASLLGESFGDADLEALSPLSAHVVRLDLSATAVSDASAAALAQMTHLRSLRLMNTRVTDATIDSIKSLQKLRSLNVVGTSVTENSLRPLRLRKIGIYPVGDQPKSVP